MPKTISVKFLRIYETFSQKEKKDFYLFVNSPYFNNKRNYTELLKKINTDESFLTNILSEKKRSTVWNRLSELTSLAEKFLILKELENNIHYNDKFLLQQLLDRRIFSIFLSKCEKVIEKGKNSPIEHSRFEQLGELYIMKSKLAFYKNDLNGISENYSLSSEYLTVDLLIKVLHRLSEIYFQKINNLHYKNSGIDELINSIDFEKYLDFLNRSSSKFYYHVLLSYNLYKFMTAPSENVELYLKSVEIFKNKMKDLSTYYKTDYYSVLINSGIHLRNLKKLKDDRIIFSLFEAKLKEGITDDISEKDFNLNRFGDYVIIALNLNKISWVEKFIEDYSNLLPEKYKENEINFVMALLEFKKKRYSEALEYQSKVKKSSNIFYILSTRLSIKANYLLGNYDNCFTEIERLKKFISKHKNSPFNQINTTPHFLKTFISLLKYKSNPDRKNREELEFLLNEKEEFVEKAWIKEVIV